MKRAIGKSRDGVDILEDYLSSLSSNEEKTSIAIANGTVIKSDVDPHATRVGLGETQSDSIPSNEASI